MAGRLKIALLLMVTVFHPDSALEAQPPTHSLPEATQRFIERCRNNAGEQAAQDVINIIQNWLVCTSFQDLYAEVYQVYTTRGVKAAIGTLCQKKDELLRCSRQILEALKPCFNEEEKESIDILKNQALSAITDFTCRHDDKIADIFASPEEIACVEPLWDKMNTCLVEEVSGDSSEGDPNPQKTEKDCKMADNLKKCTNGISGRCADSSFLDLLNSLFEEELKPLVCSHYVASTAGPLAPADTLLNQLSSSILALAVPYILYF